MTQEVWRERLRRWQASGLKIEEFAEREGVKPGSLKWWRWRLGGVDRARNGSAPQAPAPSGRFVELA
ncbi:MAG: hypothetical protein M3Y59_23445, partial [Myxococcota bacterium]|nr:hypothetical protein [Myxococcota bacterium]